VARDTDECLQIFVRLGDAWGAAEALSGRGETRELRGEFELAADDYRAAIRYAEQLGALEQVWILRCRLAAAAIESGRDAEDGERVLREVLSLGKHRAGASVWYARLQLAIRCGLTGRTAEARDLLEPLCKEFARHTLQAFRGMLEGLLGWLDIMDGQPDRALPRIRAAVELAGDPMATEITPWLRVAQLLIGARTLTALGGPDNAGVAARLLGAHEALWPKGRYLPAMDRGIRRKSEELARAELGGATYERAYAEGGGLSLSEAAALLG
jgi:hypothetical protein